HGPVAMDGGGAGRSRQHRVCGFVWRGLGRRRAGDPQPPGVRAQPPPLGGRVSRGLGLSTGAGQPLDPITGGETIIRPGGLGRPPAPETPPPPAPPRNRRQLGLLALAALAALVVVAALITVLVVAGVVGGRKPGPTPAPGPTPTPVASAGGPAGFRAEDHGSIVDLFWTDNSGGTASYFIVYRSIDGPQQTVSVPQGTTKKE